MRPSTDIISLLQELGKEGQQGNLTLRHVTQGTNSMNQNEFVNSFKTESSAIQ